MRRTLDVVVLALASGLGLGHAPVAPGTFGTLAALPLWWWMAARPITQQLVVVAAVVVGAVAVAGRAETIYAAHDVQRIVIDEVAGMAVAAIGVPFGLWTVAAAFALFRLLDATKPGPIGWLDRKVGGGVGVVLDDVAAGAAACALLHGGRGLLGAWP